MVSTLKGQAAMILYFCIFLFFFYFSRGSSFGNIAVIPDEDVSDGGGLTAQCYNADKSKQE